MTLITVSGLGERHVRAERATLTATVSVAHERRDRSMTLGQAAHTRLAERAAALRGTGAATWHSVDVLSTRVRVWTDKDGTKVFSPRASMRGDLARDQFYFYTRYRRDQPDDYSLDNFRVSLPTLLRWNKEDPVDDAERARNEAIFEEQGNRNPYVDHPAYVDRIDFEQVLKERPLG